MQGEMNMRYGGSKTNTIANLKGIGGIAIAIKKDLAWDILEITRIGDGIMKIRLGESIHGGGNNSKHICATHVLQYRGERNTGRK